MELSEQTKIESSIGFTIGILVGAFASWIFILFFVQWQWYFKVFSTIGELGIIGSLLMNLNELIKTRRNYLDTIAEIKKIEEESKKVIDNKIIEDKTPLGVG